MGLALRFLVRSFDNEKCSRRSKDDISDLAGQNSRGPLKAWTRLAASTQRFEWHYRWQYKTGEKSGVPVYGL